MAGTMTGQPALDLTHGLLSADPLLSALGLATTKRRPDCQPSIVIFFVSGTALINKTIDHLLELSKGRVAIIGPSTPMWPELLRLKGIVGLFGAKVRSSETALQTIAEGGGTKALFRNGVDKIALTFPDPSCRHT